MWALNSFPLCLSLIQINFSDFMNLFDEIIDQERQTHFASKATYGQTSETSKF